MNRMTQVTVTHRYLPELLQGHIGHRCIQPVSDPLRLSFGLNYSDGKRGTAIDLAYSIFVDEVMDGDDGPVAPGERAGLEQYKEFTHGSRSSAGLDRAVEHGHLLQGCCPEWRGPSLLFHTAPYMPSLQSE